MGEGRGKEEGYALHCLKTPKKVYEFAGSSDCSPSKKIRLTRPDYCKLASSPSSKATRSRLLDPRRTQGGRSFILGSLEHPGHHHHAREGGTPPVSLGGGTSSASIESRCTAGAGSKARWPPLASSSAVGSENCTSIFGKQPDQSTSSSALARGMAGTGHARGTCCPSTRRTPSPNMSVLSGSHMYPHLHPTQSLYGKNIDLECLSSTLSSTASTASLSPTYPASSSSSASSASGTQEQSPKKKENMIIFNKKKENNPTIISTQFSTNMQKFKPGSYLPGLGLEIPGSSLSSCSLKDSASSSSSSIRGVCTTGKGAPANQGVNKLSRGKINIGTLFATKQTLNCRNTLPVHKLPACSKTTGAEARKPADQSQGRIPQYLGTLEDYSRQPADPRGLTTSN